LRIGCHMPYIEIGNAAGDGGSPREGDRRGGQYSGAGDLEGATTPRGPGGVRYRLAFVRGGEETPAVLYDNHAPKGHHRHIEGVEEAYAFVNVDQLITDFMADIEQITGKDRWPRR
jgi:hypothetical protein